MAKQTVLPRDEELLTKYFDYREQLVFKGRGVPVTGTERATIVELMNWLCERYNIRSKMLDRKDACAARKEVACEK